MDCVMIPKKMLNAGISDISVEKLAQILNACIVAPTLNSAISGQKGEINIKSKIKNFDISDNRSTHSGDFVISRNGVRIMIEVKNYSYKVLSDQYEKFLRDFNLNNFHGAIMISNQQIANFATPLYYQGNIAILTSFDEHLINAVCELVWINIYQKLQSKYIECSELKNYAEMLQLNIIQIAEIKTSINKIKKSFKTESCKIQHNCETTINLIQKFVNRVNLQLTQDFQNPELEPQINELFKTFNIDFSDRTGNILNYINDAGKKITVKLLKTCTQISFIPKCYDFSEHTDINFKNNLIQIDINKHNINSDLFCLFKKFL